LFHFLVPVNFLDVRQHHEPFAYIGFEHLLEYNIPVKVERKKLLVLVVRENVVTMGTRWRIDLLNDELFMARCTRIFGTGGARYLFSRDSGELAAANGAIHNSRLNRFYENREFLSCFKTFLKYFYHF